MRIYDVLGRHIRTLVREWKNVGKQEIRWDGRDDAGATVASGNYILRVDAGGEAEGRWLTLLAHSD